MQPSFSEGPITIMHIWYQRSAVAKPSGMNSLSSLWSMTADILNVVVARAAGAISLLLAAPPTGLRPCKCPRSLSLC